MTETPQEHLERTSCRIEIRLVDGDRISARVDGDEAAAREELAGFHSRLDGQTFVVIGEGTIVRSEDVRYVQLKDGDSESGGFLGTVKDRFRGGDMSNYETTRMRSSSRERDDDGPGMEQWVGYGNRPWAETKPFFLTSEFLAAVLLILGILIATATNDNLDAPRGWLYSAIVGAAYILSRGFAKAGAIDPNPERGWPSGGWGGRR